MQANVVDSPVALPQLAPQKSYVALFHFGGGCVDLQWREGGLKKVEIILRSSYTQKCLWPRALSGVIQKLTDL